MLFTSYIRPHLECAVHVWNPDAKSGLEKLEKSMLLIRVKVS